MARAQEPRTGRIYECNRADDRCKSKLYSLLVGRVHIPFVMRMLRAIVWDCIHAALWLAIKNIALCDERKK